MWPLQWDLTWRRVLSIFWCLAKKQRKKLCVLSWTKQELGVCTNLTTLLTTSRINLYDHDYSSQNFWRSWPINGETLLKPKGWPFFFKVKLNCRIPSPLFALQTTELDLNRIWSRNFEFYSLGTTSFRFTTQKQDTECSLKNKTPGGVNVGCVGRSMDNHTLSGYTWIKWI